MSKYQNIDAWKHGMDLVDAVYAAVEHFPASERFNLSQQMRASARSIPANIAEGNGRRTNADYRHFVYQARGSAYELETDILIAQRRGFLRQEAAERLLAMTRRACQLINGVLRYLDRRIEEDC